MCPSDPTRAGKRGIFVIMKHKGPGLDRIQILIGYYRGAEKLSILIKSITIQILLVLIANDFRLMVLRIDIEKAD